MTATSNVGPWVVPPVANPQARLNLLCFPHAGGSPAQFRGWPTALPASIAVCPILLPGRERRRSEPLPTQFDDLVDRILDGIGPFLDRPFAFFGHSFGALLAVESARRLQERRGLSPAHLFVAARLAPHRSAQPPRLHHLPDDQFTQEIVRRYNGIPPAILADPSFLAYFLPVLRADFTMLENYVYRPGTVLRCPVSAFGGRGDAEVSRDDLAAWHEVTEGDFALKFFAGDHFFMFAEPAAPLACIADSLQPLLR